LPLDSGSFRQPCGCHDERVDKIMFMLVLDGCGLVGLVVAVRHFVRNFALFFDIAFFVAFRTFGDS